MQKSIKAYWYNHADCEARVSAQRERFEQRIEKARRKAEAAGEEFKLKEQFRQTVFYTADEGSTFFRYNETSCHETWADVVAEKEQREAQGFALMYPKTQEQAWPKTEEHVAITEAEAALA